MPAILVVDDDLDILDMLCAVLAAAGYAVERAAGALDALDVIEWKPIDLLVDGRCHARSERLQLARVARLRRADIRVLYMSGYMERQTIAGDAGPHLDKLLAKPIRPARGRRSIGRAADWDLIGLLGRSVRGAAGGRCAGRSRMLSGFFR